MLSVAMRLRMLWVWFSVLVGVLLLIWQYRFERLSTSPTFRLADLKHHSALPPGVQWVEADGNPRLTLDAKPAPGETVVRFELPFTEPIDFLHLKVGLSAIKLIPGNQWWQDGRGMIEWQPSDHGRALENDGFGSVRYDQSGGITEFVMRPDHPPAIPAMRLENLGNSGELQLLFFEATVLRERWIWKIGRWLLMVGWIAWVFVWIQHFGNRRTTRALLASIVWFLIGIYFVLPGPWKIQRPFGRSFELGAPAKYSQITIPSERSESTADQRLTVENMHTSKSVGEIPTKGDFALRLKQRAAHLRPLLHGLLLFGPTLLTACLVGRKPAQSLAMLIAIAIEAAQYAFGYGFDLKDILDLACNAVGIVLALAVHAYFKRRFPKLDLG